MMFQLIIHHSLHQRLLVLAISILLVIYGTRNEFGLVTGWALLTNGLIHG